MSIVLVILGLLAGGILSGQSLIRAAELRGVITDYTRFVTATQTFRDKYFALPGDMNNATKFWGTQDANPAICAVTASVGKLTCDGDGDGKIYPISGIVSNESFRYWQHLANAGLIEGTYDGITHGSTIYSATLANSPKGKIGGTIWFVWQWPYAQSGNAAFFDGDYGNRFSVGNVVPDSGPSDAIFRPDELWNIDTKLDDGKPGRGKVMTKWFGGCTSATSSADLDAPYLLTSTSRICLGMFPNAF